MGRRGLSPHANVIKLGFSVEFEGSYMVHVMPFPTRTHLPLSPNSRICTFHRAVNFQRPGAVAIFVALLAVMIPRFPKWRAEAVVNSDPATG